MTNPARRPRVASATVLVLAVVALALGLVTAAPTTAGAATADDSGVSVTITGVSPTLLSDDATVTLTGVVTNEGEEEWTAAQAYLVIPHTPFTTRQQVRDAVDTAATYTGERVVELDSIDDLGTLTPGEDVPFRVRVPYDSLDVNGAEGVYPVGVQILATAEDGTREAASIARATTFLPLVEDAPSVPSGIAWPFLSTTRIDADGQYVDPQDLVERVAPGGQLRNVLDQAQATPSAGTTVIVDPALLVALDDLVNDRRVPDDQALDEDQREQTQAFLDELLDLARRVTCWTLEYGRPDVLAVTRSADAGALSTALEEATSQVLDRFGLSGRRVVWPTRGGTTAGLVEAVREDGERPVVVTQEAVPNWEPRLGSIVSRRTPSGPVPLLVVSALDQGVPGARTVATVRQRLLGEAALAALERSADPESRSDAVVLMDPTWDPGPTGQGTLAPAFEADGVVATDLERLLSTQRSVYAGDMPATTSAEPLSNDQLEAVESMVEAGDVLAALVVDASAVEAALVERAADLLSVGWRGDRVAGTEAARAALAQTQRRLDGLTVEGPPAVTLSSSEGSFPLTVSNDTDDAVRIGARISSSNPALEVPDVEPVEVAAGERRTLTVSVDVGEQNSSTLTAQLVTVGGTAVGAPDSFNVRSSRVGAALWVAMGAAGVFVLFALLRRFRRGAPSDQPTEQVAAGPGEIDV